MYCTRKVAEDIYWIGGSDRRLDGHDLHKEEKAYHREEEDGHGRRRFQGDAPS